MSLSPADAREEYAFLLDEARALLELGLSATELRPRVRELVGRLNERIDEARRVEDELREVHRRVYHLETCLEGSSSTSLPPSFPAETRESPSARSRPSELAD